MPKYLLYWPGRQGVREKYFLAKGVRSPKSLGTADLTDSWCINVPLVVKLDATQIVR